MAKENDNSPRLVIDTREQRGLWSEGPGVVRKKLDTGDYSLEGHEHVIAYERKSPVDLRSSLTSGHERFKRELERSLELKHFAIIVDVDQTKFLNNNFEGAKHSKVPPGHVFKILCTLNIKYGVEFYFTGGRNASRALIKGLFEAYIRNNNIKRK